MLHSSGSSVRAPGRLKQHIASPPVMSVPTPTDPLFLYLAVMPHSISVVLVCEEIQNKKPVYYNHLVRVIKSPSFIGTSKAGSQLKAEYQPVVSVERTVFYRDGPGLISDLGVHGIASKVAYWYCSFLNFISEWTRSIETILRRKRFFHD